MTGRVSCTLNKSIIKIILMQDIEIDKLLQVKRWPVLQSSHFHTYSSSARYYYLHHTASTRVRG